MSDFVAKAQSENSINHDENFKQYATAVSKMSDQKIEGFLDEMRASYQQAQT